MIPPDNEAGALASYQVPPDTDIALDPTTFPGNMTDMGRDSIRRVWNACGFAKAKNALDGYSEIADQEGREQRLHVLDALFTSNFGQVHNEKQLFGVALRVDQIAEMYARIIKAIGGEFNLNKQDKNNVSFKNNPFLLNASVWWRRERMMKWPPVELRHPRRRINWWPRRG